MKITATIMAGGKGERFWPKSRVTLPKQFLSLTNDGLTMIQHTINRLLNLIKYEDIFIVTNINYVKLVKEQLPQIPDENILVEPIGKNTAPCIGLAATIIKKKYKDAIMLVLPSDHLIKNNEQYNKTLKQAINIAKNNYNLVTIGILPSYPETGYGYINYDKQEIVEKKNRGYKVKRFVEKPNINKAKEYINSGDYLWNSGMFVWKVSSILMNIEKYMPDLANGLTKIRESIGSKKYLDVLYNCFNDFKSESIDYGIMEKADSIYTVSGDFGWDDVGSWLALERINQLDENKNYIDGNVIIEDTKDSIVLGGKRLIATVGLENTVIVDTDDAILICDKNSTQKIKDIIKKIKENNQIQLI